MLRGAAAPEEIRLHLRNDRRKSSGRVKSPPSRVNPFAYFAFPNLLQSSGLIKILERRSTPPLAYLRRDEYSTRGENMLRLNRIIYKMSPDLLRYITVAGDSLAGVSFFVFFYFFFIFISVAINSMRGNFLLRVFFFFFFFGSERLGNLPCRTQS